MQNSPFSSLTVAVTIASTHCAYPRRDGQAELAWVAGYVMRQLDIFCHVTGLTSDFLSFIVVELIQFFHGALQLILLRSVLSQPILQRLLSVTSGPLDIAEKNGWGVVCKISARHNINSFKATNNNNSRSMDIFQDNLGKTVPECHHSGVYWS